MIVKYYLTNIVELRGNLLLQIFNFIHIFSSMNTTWVIIRLTFDKICRTFVIGIVIKPSQFPMLSANSLVIEFIIEKTHQSFTSDCQISDKQEVLTYPINISLIDTIWFWELHLHCLSVSQNHWHCRDVRSVSFAQLTQSTSTL